MNISQLQQFTTHNNLLLNISDGDLSTIQYFFDRYRLLLSLCLKCIVRKMMTLVNKYKFNYLFTFIS